MAEITASIVVAPPNTGEDVVRVALEICGCGVTIIDSIFDNNLDDMDCLRRLTNSDIVSLGRTISSAKITRGGTKFGITRVKKVQALCIWAKMRHSCGLPIDTDKFTQVELNTELDLYVLGEDNKSLDEKTITKPKNFEPI